MGTSRADEETEDKGKKQKKAEECDPFLHHCPQRGTYAGR